MKIKKTESGQVIVLMVIGFVSLLAFAGLAIDGGRYYAEQRTIQNVADTTAFTGAKRLASYASEDITSSIMTESEYAALNRAESNGYDDAAANVTVTVDIVKEPSPSYYYLITVEITSEIEPTFIKIVRNEPLPVSARAVARVLPKINVGFGFSMFSASQTECDAFKFTGSSNTEITGSGIYSNSNCSCSFAFEGSGNTVVTGGIDTAGGICTNGSGGYASGGGTDEYLPQLDIPNVDPPDCGSVWPWASAYWVGSELHLLPGNYNGFGPINGGHYVLEDGLYCINGNLRINGGIVEGANVMFYLTNGDFKVTGGDLDLSAGQNGEVVDASGTVWDGWLIFMDADNDQLVDISGNADTILVGTVWAPDPPFNTNLPKCSFSGGGNMTGVNLQFVCYSIQLSGSSNMILHFDEDQQADFPVILDLYE